MKKIAFVATKFTVGGLEKSLLELIDIIDHNQYEVTVFLPNKDGEWTHLLQEKVNVIILEPESFRFLVKKYLKEFDLIKLLRTLMFRAMAVILSRRNYYKGLKYRVKSMTKYPEHFDAAIAYQVLDEYAITNCLYRIDADKKILWVHQRFNTMRPDLYNWYIDFDKVFCVSEHLKIQTQTMYPKLNDKTEVFYNITNPDKIKKLADELPTELRTCKTQFVLVTVGRLSLEKGQDKIPQVARLLLEKGYSFIWYLVGDGPLETELREKIKQYDVINHVVLCGRKDNPYPYIKNCDIYVQTSQKEGWGLTVSEAKILHKPIVTTYADVMSEQIENGINGIITENDSAEEICKAIELLMVNSDLRKSFVEVLEKQDVSRDNTKELQKLYNLME